MNNKTCPICKLDNQVLSSGIKNGKVVSERCERCLANYRPISPFSRKYDRDRGREDYRRDIIQRFEGDKINPEFVKAYPIEAERQWGADVLRDHTEGRRKQY